jgi:hypothetical protein
MGRLSKSSKAASVGGLFYLELSAVGTFRTWRDVRLESVKRSKADITIEGRQVRL